ncbi:MAG: hypothetical protein R2681_14645 [Pyrinomonadaceae bacterium]
MSCKTSIYKINLFASFTISILLAIVLAADAFPQSIEQNRPTPIVSNEISGQIKARDIGDSRLTTYYFAFNGERGDIFINVVTKNLNGDIDIYELNGLVPRTKIAVYADSSSNETGRVVYLRKPEKLLLRIQGRTPDDDPATYQIKFAGSFQPLTGIAETEDSETPEIKEKPEGPVRVNSVGTIIEDEKPAEEAKPETEDVSGVSSDPLPKTTTEIPSVFDPRKRSDRDESEENKSRPRVIIEDPLSPKSEDSENISDMTVEITDKSKEPKTLITIERVEDDDEKAADETPEQTDLSPEKEAELKVAALQKINLVITLKNGKKFEKRMSKVSSFNVFDGVLKVVAIDGEVTKFSILDVEKITIQ